MGRDSTDIPAPGDCDSSLNSKVLERDIICRHNPSRSDDLTVIPRPSAWETRGVAVVADVPESGPPVIPSRGAKTRLSRRRQVGTSRS